MIYHFRAQTYLLDKPYAHPGIESSYPYTMESGASQVKGIIKHIIEIIEKAGDNAYTDRNGAPSDSPTPFWRKS